MEVVVDNLVKERIPPPAPPLPCPTTVVYPKKIVKSRAKHISSNKDQCSLNTETRVSYDRLFDEAYRADVVVHTDSGGQIYVHASILVRFLKILFEFRHCIEYMKLDMFDFC